MNFISKSVLSFLCFVAILGCEPKKVTPETDTPSIESPTPTPTATPVPAASFSYPTALAAYEVLSPITPISPASTALDVATLSNFRSSPLLPSGMALNTSTGEITANAFTRWDARTYTITADKQSGGTASGTLVFGVYGSGEISNDPTSTIPRNFAYQTSDVVYLVGHPISPVFPVHQGAAASSYSQNDVRTDLGLTFDTANGMIGGTPTGPLAKTEAAITLDINGQSYYTTFTYTIDASPPANLEYTTSAVTYPRFTSIPANSPTSIGGQILYYLVSPSLPAGLTMDMWTGVITGTPTSLTPTASYTVSAENGQGAATKVLTITIGETAPVNLNYTTNNARYTINNAISTNSPLPGGSGGNPTSYAISPALPTGLSLDTTSGNITGTPTVATAVASYTVTATNAQGSTTKALSIVVVNPGPKTLYATDGSTIKGYSVDVVTGEPSYQGTTLSSSVSSKLIFHPTLDCAFGYSATNVHAFTINKSSLGAIAEVNSASGLDGPVGFGMTASGSYIFVVNNTNPTTQTVSRFSVDGSTCAVTHLGNSSVHSDNFAFSVDMAISGSNLYVLTYTSKIKQYAIDGSGAISYVRSTDMVAHANPPSMNPALGSGKNLRAHGTYLYATDDFKAVESFSVNGSTGALTYVTSMVNSGTYYQNAPSLDVSTGFIFSNYISSTSAGVSALRLNADGSIGVNTIEGSNVAPSFNSPKAVGAHASESGTYVYTSFSYPGKSGSARLKLDATAGTLTKVGDGLMGQVSGY